MSTANHWDTIYSTTSTDRTSWFQDPPAESLRLVLRHSVPSDSIVDVGSGASLLVDHLLDHGYDDITIVDLSAAALDSVRERLSIKGQRVKTVTADVTSWSPPRRFDLWHDRAVFHFLVDPRLQRAYLATVARSVEPGGVVIVGTFGPSGPTTFSGLPVQRHSADSLSEVFSHIGTLIGSSEESHLTPSGARQEFVWSVFRLRASPVSPGSVSGVRPEDDELQ